jgi:GNAT superfamily N-acetyltransferase
MIRIAKSNESKVLTNISFKSKGYWNYPKQFFVIWQSELTITEKYINENKVFILEENALPIAFYSIVKLESDIEISGIKLPKGFWLDHMFILPEFIGKGFGTEMFGHLVNYCRKEKIPEIGILADPNAKLFYEKMGCEYQREYPSTIQNRTTPFLKYRLKDR